MKTLAERFIHAAEKWVGTPYVSKGCTPGPTGGTSCGHYFLQCMLEVIPHSSKIAYLGEYSHQDVLRKHLDVVTVGLRDFADEIPVDSMRRGDIGIIFYFHTPMSPTIYLGEGEFIYCSREGIEKGQIPANLKKRIQKAYRWREECL